MHCIVSQEAVEAVQVSFEFMNAFRLYDIREITRCRKYNDPVLLKA